MLFTFEAFALYIYGEIPLWNEANMIFKNTMIKIGGNEILYSFARKRLYKLIKLSQALSPFHTMWIVKKNMICKLISDTVVQILI